MFTGPPVPSPTLLLTAALLNPRLREHHANDGTCVACLVVNGLAAVSHSAGTRSSGGPEAAADVREGFGRARLRDAGDSARLCAVRRCAAGRFRMARDRRAGWGQRPDLRPRLACLFPVRADGADGPARPSGERGGEPGAVPGRAGALPRRPAAGAAVVRGACPAAEHP